MTSDGQPFHRAKYKQIVQEQTMIGYLTKGGVSFRDTEYMTPYERKLVLDTMKEVIDRQNQAHEEAVNRANSQNKDPKTGWTSGVKV